MAGITAPDSYTLSGQYTSNWFSTADIKMPDIQRTAVEKYGKSFGFFEIFDLMGNTYNMPNDTHSIYEKDSVERLVTLADIGSGVGVATGAAGADISFKINTSEYDARYNTYLRVGDAVLIPVAYLASGTLMDYNYVVKSKSGTTNDITYVASPLLKDGTTFAAAQIAVAVPIGTKLAVTFDAYGRGTSQPRGTTTNWYKRTYRTAIHKETFEIEGGNESQTWIPITLDMKGMIVAPGTAGSRSGFITIGQQQAEFLLNKKVNNSLFIGQPNENAAAGVVTNNAGESTPLLTTTGLLPTMQLLAQKAPYTNQFDVSQLDDIKPLLISQGLTAQHIFWGVGDLLYKDAENACYNFIKEFGHDPIMQGLHDVGLEFKSVQKLGFKFILREMSNFSNPNNYGAAAYNDYYRRLGIMIPMGDNDVRVGSEDGKPAKIGNLTIGYKNYNGENRTRVMGLVNGMTGHPFPVVSDVDVIKGYALTEVALITVKANQFILQSKV